MTNSSSQLSGGSNQLLNQSELDQYRQSQADMPLRLQDPKSQQSQKAVQNACLELWQGKRNSLVNEPSLFFDWTFAHVKRRVLGSKSSPIQTVKQVSAVLSEMEKYEFTEGKSLKPYEFLTGEVCPDPSVREVLRYCLGDKSISSLQMLKVLPKKFLVIASNSPFMEMACHSIKVVLAKIGEQLKSDPSIDVNFATIVIKNILALFTYMGLQEGQLYQVPVHIHGSWKLIDYRLEKLKLTHDDYPFSPYYAFGLVPCSTNESAPAQLLYMGTTYPSAVGSLFTYVVDAHPFKSPGREAFDQGKEVIAAFLMRMQQSGYKVHIVGQSLGGAMANHTVAEFPSLVERSDAFSPPAQWKSDVSHLDEWLVERAIHSSTAKPPFETPQINIYRHKNDHVPIFGNMWPSTSKVHYVQGWDDQDSISAHIRVEATGEKAQMVTANEQVRPSIKRFVLEAARRMIGFLPWVFVCVCQWVYSSMIALAQYVRKLGKDAYPPNLS